MANYKLVIQYDGTRYRGWQGQNDTDLTIQGKIEAVLSAMAGYPVEVTGSGRTDAGVHARGQVANFHLKENTLKQNVLGEKPIKESMSPEEILSYLNQYLPEDIGVLSVEEVDERFHSRYHAVEKTYLYRIHTGKVPEIFGRKYVYNYQASLSAEPMRSGAAALIGTHDFKSFCGNRKMKKSTVRTIFNIRIEELPGEICIYYTGDGFLQNMVRILTGTLIEIGDGRRPPEEMTKILEARDREAAGFTAPACGLTLIEVKY